MEFKDKLKKLRQDAGMTQDELAQKLLVTRKQISKWETGNSLPTNEMMLKLSEIFKVKLEYLMDNNVITTNSSNQNADGVDIDSIKPRNWLLIILIILAILISMCLIYGIVQNKKNNNARGTTITEDHSDHVSVSSYNIFIESYAGVHYSINVGKLLTHILENNNKYNRQIVVVFNNVELNGNEAIKEKRKALANDDNSKYDVDFKYDSEGYIVKAIIEKI